MTRAGSAAIRRGVRVIGPATSRSTSLQHRREAPACCKVDSTARVDSAPWFWFTLSACSPSKPPPVCGSHIRRPASLAPSNYRRGAHGVRPDGAGVDPGGPRAGVGEGGHLDRLLVESWSGVARSAAPGRGG